MAHPPRTLRTPSNPTHLRAYSLPIWLLLQEAKDEAPKPYSAREGMAGIVGLLEKSVKTKETRLLMGRLMRQTAQLRGHMSAADLQAFISTYLPEGSKSGAYLAGYIKQVQHKQGRGGT